jgi:hypothetical protein
MIILAAIALLAASANDALGYWFSSLTVPIAIMHPQSRRRSDRRAPRDLGGNSSGARMIMAAASAFRQIRSGEPGPR